MLNLSLPSTPSPPCFYSFPRVSLSLSSSSTSSSSHNFSLLSISSSSSVRLFTSRRSSSSSRSFVYYSFEVRGMAELVQDAEKTSAAVASSAAATSGADESENSNNKNSSNEIKHSRTFVNVRSEEELLSAIRKETEAGKIPPNIAAGMEELYHNYKSAVFESKISNLEEVVLSNMRVALDRVLLDVKDPFVFSPYHKALREPFDYYMFGQNYIRPLIDFKNSYVGNISLFDEIIQKAQQGHNVVLLSNHQTEADPAIIALLLESTHVHIAENAAYVAGDRVITDPLCKPFSMGRNLLCVYSKKHMFDVPELAEMKRRANTRSLKEMALLLRGGSQIIWIAPSGGRDRPDPVTKEWRPAPFDSSSVDNMRRLVEHSGVPGHIYPLALQCYEIMPPPPKVEKEIGEKRIIAFRGAGLSVAPPLNFNEVIATCKNTEEVKEAYSQALYESVNEQYEVLKSAIQDKKGLEASTMNVSLSQPWN